MLFALLDHEGTVASLPSLPNTNLPTAVDVLTDPTASSPTAYGTSTDHALEHATINDAVNVISNAILGTQQTVNSTNGLALIDQLGRLPLSGIVPNVNLWAYGHNALLVPPASATTGADVLTVTKNRLGLRTATTYAIASTRMIDVFYDLLGGYGSAVSGATWPGGSGVFTGRPGIVLIDAEKSDFYNPTNSGGTTWGNLTTGANSQVVNYQNALTAAIALIQSASRIESSTGTQTGTWTTNSGNFSGGSMLSTTTQGNTLTFTGVTVPSSGVLWLLGYVNTTATGDTQISVNSSVITTATTSGLAGASAIYSQRASSINNPSTYQPQITQIAGLTPNSTVTVTLTKSDSSTNPINVDSILVPAAAPPLVIVVKDNLGNNTNPVPTAPVTGWATQLTVATVNKPLLDAAIANVTSLFNTNTQSVVTVDLGTGLSSTDLSYVTGNAPNDRGMRKFSDLLSYGIGNWSYRNDSDGLYTTL